jgi:alkylhydroperoxidase family enzyme
VQFLSIYVREAHPVEGWRSGSNDQVGVVVKQPKTMQEREEVAKNCCAALEMSMPLLVDRIDDRIGHAYSGMPDRLYVIDRQGRVVYKGGRGPFGFKPGEMEQSLAMLLLDEAAPAAQSRAFVPLLEEKEAWKLLPVAGPDAGKRLPEWARALARTMPATTATMLELDYLQRVKNPIEARLRGKLRWVAAHANRCACTEEQALADLRRAGATETELALLTGDPDRWPESEREVLTFARKLTRVAHQVTDEEVAALVKKYGERQVVAMVLLLAHASFQDRLLLTLGLAPRPERPCLPPLEVRANLKKLDGSVADVPPRRRPDTPAPPPSGARGIDWGTADFSSLQRDLLKQKARPGRVRVPSWDEVAELPGPKPARPVRIKWSLVCMGYQPELASGWSACTRNFGRESKQDRVFEESLFWVVTRSLQCFY